MEALWGLNAKYRNQMHLLVALGTVPIYSILPLRDEFLECAELVNFWFQIQDLWYYHGPRWFSFSYAVLPFPFVSSLHWTFQPNTEVESEFLIKTQQKTEVTRTCYGAGLVSSRFRPQERKAHLRSDTWTISCVLQPVSGWVADRRTTWAEGK